jgi:hypothetical protein
VKLYKYMQSQKFEDLIEKSQLYFRRIDCFEDRNEGRKTIPSNGKIPDYTADDQNNVSVVEFYEKADNEGLKHYFVCCWHKGFNEKIDMWEQYGGKNNSISIVTQSERVTKAARGVFLRHMDIDYKNNYKQDFNHNDHPELRCFQKDCSFFKENELRTIFYDYTPKIMYDHVGIKVDLDTLIEKIIVSPFSSIKYIEDVYSLLEKTNNNLLKERIVQSELKKE